MNPEIIERLLQSLAEGESLKKAAKAEGVSFQSVLRLREKDPVFSDQYTRARLIGYERLADDKEAAKAARTRSTGGATPRARSGGSRTTPLERQGGRVASGVFNTIVRELMRGILGTPSRRRR